MLLGGPLLLSPVAPHLPVLWIPAAVAAPSETPTQRSIQPTASPACVMSLAGFILEVLNVADNILAPVYTKNILYTLLVGVHPILHYPTIKQNILQSPIS